jgi:HEPN domain-containing protein
MLKTGRYIYVIFMCHLAIEKLLKAVVAQSQETHPPYTHDLNDLIERVQLEIPSQHRAIVATLSEASVPARYPEDLAALVKYYPKPIAQKYFEQSKAFLKWLKSDPRLK